jgi:hypothetical protein
VKALDKALSESGLKLKAVPIRKRRRSSTRDHD